MRPGKGRVLGPVPLAVVVVVLFLRKSCSQIYSFDLASDPQLPSSHQGDNTLSLRRLGPVRFSMPNGLCARRPQKKVSARGRTIEYLEATPACRQTR
jgi:hypothetical protein